MTNQEIWDTALSQSAADCGCRPEDFLRPENLIVRSKKNPAARKYLDLPLPCNLVFYGNGIVASVEEELEADVRGYISRFPTVHCFETPNLHVLNELMEKKGMRVCFMAEYFLPDVNLLKELSCDLETRLLEPRDFEGLYTEQWSNALCEKRRELDILGMGAYDNGRLAGLAGCSADCESMWQIGIDVLEGYRRRGVASALVSGLALAAMERGKVPFYCAAWSNIRSVRTAIRSGFRPAWVELTVKKREFVDEMNGVKEEKGDEAAGPGEARTDPG